jgi:hypothetical protein
MGEESGEKEKSKGAKKPNSWLFYTKNIASKSGGIWWVILAVSMVAVIFLILILSSKGLLGASSSLSSFSRNS